jgi:CTP:molybdopterin cytidylyltransferase MocA
MVLRVLDALGESRCVRGVTLCGLDPAGVKQAPKLQEAVAEGQLSLLDGEASPSASAWSALQRIPGEQPVLLTTADHALLRAEWVDYFLDQANRTGADLVVAVARYEQIAEAMPGVRRTVTRLRDDGYCGCNLFAFMTPRSRVAADYWRQVERDRKRPWRVIRMLGWGSVLRYLLHRLTLDQALQRLSRQFGLSIAPVIMPFPEASVDVDTPEDWELVKRLVSKGA